MASKCIAKLAQSRSLIASLCSLNHSIQVYLQSHSITPSKCISKLARLWHPSTHDHGLPSASLNSFDHGLGVHLHTRSITLSKCISIPAWLQPPSSHYYGLQVYTITASKCISKLTWSWPQSASQSSLNHGMVIHWRSQAYSLSSTLRPTLYGIRRKFLKRSSYCSNSIGKGWEDMKGYPAMMNHTHCVDLWRLGKSAWGTIQDAWVYESSVRGHEAKNWKR